MGTQYRFKCPTCGYKADVAGGDDAGELSYVRTIHCQDCKRLYDVVIEDRGSHPGREHPLICPKSGWHIVTPWHHPGPCPKCGSILQRSEPVVIWD